jgi:hypothetical protein
MSFNPHQLSPVRDLNVIFSGVLNKGVWLQALKSGELLADLKQTRNEEVQISPPEINGPEPETAEESNEASSMLEG